MESPPERGGTVNVSSVRLKCGATDYEKKKKRDGDVVSTKFRQCIFNPGKPCTYLPSFNVQFVWERSFLKTTYDVIMTSSVPNLGHVISIQVMLCTYLPSFKVQFVWEVNFLNFKSDL